MAENLMRQYWWGLVRKAHWVILELWPQSAFRITSLSSRNSKPAPPKLNLVLRGQGATQSDLFLSFPLSSLSVTHWRPWIPAQLSTVCLPWGCTGGFHKGRQWLYFSTTLAFLLLNSPQSLLATAFTLRRQFSLFKQPFFLSFYNSVVLYLIYFSSLSSSQLYFFSQLRCRLC